LDRDFLKHLRHRRLRQRPRHQRQRGFLRQPPCDAHTHTHTHTHTRRLQQRP
jgi:hypothetical protein